MTPASAPTTRRIARSSTTCRGEIADLLQGIFTAELVFNILSLLLGLMTLAFTWGFVKDIKN